MLILIEHTSLLNYLKKKSKIVPDLCLPLWPPGVVIAMSKRKAEFLGRVDGTMCPTPHKSFHPFPPFFLR